MKIIFYISTFFLLTPIVAFGAITTFKQLLDLFLVYAEQVIYLLSILILIAFLWGVADFIRKSGQGGEVEEAKKRLWWGLVALFVAFSLWGILSFLTGDFFGPTVVDKPPKISEEKIFQYFPKNTDALKK